MRGLLNSQNMFTPNKNGSRGGVELFENGQESTGEIGSAFPATQGLPQQSILSHCFLVSTQHGG